jgi:hypothetical protein
MLATVTFLLANCWWIFCGVTPATPTIVPTQSPAVVVVAASTPVPTSAPVGVVDPTVAPTVAPTNVATATVVSAAAAVTASVPVTGVIVVDPIDPSDQRREACGSEVMPNRGSGDGTMTVMANWTAWVTSDPGFLTDANGNRLAEWGDRIVLILPEGSYVVNTGSSTDDGALYAWSCSSPSDLFNENKPVQEAAKMPKNTGAPATILDFRTNPVTVR